jgi:hypothetical protein
MLSMSYKENADHLGKGSGINLRSSDRTQPRPENGDGGTEGTDTHDGGPSSR